MDRRHFLGSIMALAAAASVGAANAGIPTRYHTALQLLDNCRGIDDVAEVHTRVDALLKYCRENFPAPESTLDLREDMRNILKRGELSSIEHEAFLRSIPPKVADSLFPVALMKLGLAHYQLADLIDPCKLSEFGWFAKTYCQLVLDAY